MRMPINPPPSKVFLRAMTAIAFGDSISDVNMTEFQSTNFLISANAQLGWPFEILGDYGVSGNTTTQMLARVDAALAVAPSVVTVLGGTNDQSSIAAGDISTSGTTIGNLYRICEAFRRAGSIVALCTVPPNNFMVGTTSDAITRRGHQVAVNRWIRTYAQTTPGVRICDVSRVLASPSSFEARSGLTSDGLHPNPAGAVVIGAELARVLAPIVGVMDTGLSYPYDPYNYVSNPMMAGDNADGVAGWDAVTGVTGNGPSGIKTRIRNTGSAVASKVARSDTRYGDDLARLAITASADYDGAGFVVGSDDVLATGRYDQAWAATTAYTLADRKRPTVANGYIYRVVTAGTTGGSEPTWPTTEGSTIVDGTVTWMCQRMPQTGDVFYGECDLYLSGLTAGKWASVMATFRFVDTTATSTIVYGHFFNLGGGSTGKGGTYLPPYMRIRTPNLTVPSGTCRHLSMTIFGYGEAGATFNMDVARAAIMRASP